MYVTQNSENPDMKETATQRYEAENEYVFSLPRVIASGSPKEFYPHSVFWLLFKKLASLRIVKQYVKHVIVNWKWFIKLKKIRNHGLAANAIVIGNGPSQGFLDIDCLRQFKANGGHIYCVNYWTVNKDLCEVVPTHMVTSDPFTLSPSVPDYAKEKDAQLLSFLKEHVSIKIFCPLERCESLAEIFGSDRIVGFVDQELRLWSTNINPMYPRGYLSMTLFKALAMAMWVNYQNIYIIGMDNTYPRNIYCDENNKIINHEIHTEDLDFSVDQSAIYKNTGDCLIEIAQIFYDAKIFKNKKIVNLDPYSLTNVFNKSDLPISNISKILTNTIKNS